MKPNITWTKNTLTVIVVLLSQLLTLRRKKDAEGGMIAGVILVGRGRKIEQTVRGIGQENKYDVFRGI